jgi:hypothetical protein
MASAERLTFEQFRDAVLAAVERICAAFDPEEGWPGVLFLEVPRRGLVIGEICDFQTLSAAKTDDLATRILPSHIRASRAERFAWLMPGVSRGKSPQECLFLLLAERGRREGLVVEVIRGDGPPVLGEMSSPASHIDGLFVDPLCKALLAPRPAQWKRRRGGCGPSRHPEQPARCRKQARTNVRCRPGGRPLIANCPDCDVAIGEPHRPGCDVERCSVCYGQRLLCGCVGHEPLEVVWEGEQPGAAACRFLGWWAVRTGAGWRPCPPGTPGASEDLNRLSLFRVTGRDCLYDGVD